MIGILANVINEKINLLYLYILNHELMFLKNIRMLVILSCEMTLMSITMQIQLHENE